MIFAYTRISTTKKTQKHDRQQLTIQTYADENNFIVNEWISETISGTVAAKEKGHSLGRPKADVPTDFIREYNKLINGEYGSMSKVQFAKMLDMGRSTVYKYITMLNDKATSQTF